MSNTQFILVCPDTYEYIYPSMLYSNVQQEHLASNIRDIEGLVGMTSFNLGAKAMALLSVSPKAADQNGGPLQEPVPGVVGRWFNKRIAILTEGKLFNKLRDQAEGEISAARLAALATPEDTSEEFDSGDFLVDGILDALVEPLGDDEEDIEEAEDTVEDKEEFIPKEQEYSNISGLVRDYLVKTGQADDDNMSSTEFKVRLGTRHTTEKIKVIKLLREIMPGLTEAKLFFEKCESDPQELYFADREQAEHFIVAATALGCEAAQTPIGSSHPATVRPLPEPVMKTKTKTTAKPPKEEEVPDLAAIVDAVVSLGGP